MSPRKLLEGEVAPVPPCLPELTEPCCGPGRAWRDQEGCSLPSRLARTGTYPSVHYEIATDFQFSFSFFFFFDADLSFSVRTCLKRLQMGLTLECL